MPPVMGVARARQLGPEGSFTRALRIAVAGGQDGWTEVAWEAPASDAQRSPRQVCYGPANNVRCMTLETIVLPSDSSAVGLPAIAGERDGSLPATQADGTHSRSCAKGRIETMFRLPVILFGMAMSLAATAASADQLAGSAGGTGGKAFTARCAPGTYLKGIAYRAGDDIDSVAAICFDPKNPASTRPTSAHGGRGGEAGTLVCQDHEPYVRAVKVIAAGAATTVVKGFQIWCSPRQQATLPPVPSAEFLAGGSNKNFGSGRYPCGPNAVAVGLYGRSGNMVDALGMVCDQEPAGSPAQSKPVPKSVTVKPVPKADSVPMSKPN